MTTGSLIPDNGSDSRLFSQFWYLQGKWFTWEPLQRPLLLSGLTSLALPRYLSMVASAIGSYVRFTWMMLT